MDAPENPVRVCRLANLRTLYHTATDLDTKLWAMAEFLRELRAEFLAAKFSVREVRFPPPLPPEEVIGVRRGVDPFGEDGTC